MGNTARPLRVRLLRGRKLVEGLAQGGVGQISLDMRPADTLAAQRDEDVNDMLDASDASGVRPQHRMNLDRDATRDNDH